MKHIRKQHETVEKNWKSSAIGKEDSYERNPSGVSFVCNHRFFRTFQVLKNRTQLVKKDFFDKLSAVFHTKTC